MGNIQLLRIFIDYNEFEGSNDSDNFKILITELSDPEQKEFEWQHSLISELKVQFGDDSPYYRMQHPRYETISGPGVFANQALMPFTPDQLTHDCVNTWHAIQDKAEGQLIEEHNDLILYADSVIGGHPSWI